MAVIKQTRAREIVHHTEVFDLGDVKRQAQQLLADAQRDADAIVQKARQEAQRLTSGAAQEGYARGFEQGLNEGRERGSREGFEETVKQLTPRLQTLIDAWNAALMQWESDRTCMFLEAKRDVLELALRMARMIVHRHIAVDQSVVADQLVAALKYVGKTSSLVVAVHPSDRELMSKTMPALLEQLGRCEQVALRDEPSLQPGGCVIATEGGRVDASIETQLRRLTESLIPGAPSDRAAHEPDDRLGPADEPGEGEA